MEELVSSKYVYRGSVLNLRLDTVRLADGKESLREIAEHRGAVAIVPLDDEERVTLVRQYRAAIGRELLEIPAGTLDEGEAAELGAPRELKEETGLTARRWDTLVRFYGSPGVLTEEMVLYLARDLSQGELQLMDDEDIEVVKLPLSDALELIAGGEIADAKTIIGLLLTRDKLRLSSNY